MKTKSILISGMMLIGLLMFTGTAHSTFVRPVHRSQFRYGNPQWQKEAGAFRYDAPRSRSKTHSRRAKYDQKRRRYQEHRDGYPGGAYKRIRNKRYRSSYRSRRRYSRPEVIVVQPVSVYSPYRVTVDDSLYYYDDYGKQASAQTVLKHGPVASPIVKRIKVYGTLRRKIDFIIENGIAEGIFAETESDFEESFYYSADSRTLVITAMPDSTARLLTILRDYDTYKNYRSLYNSSSELEVAVVSLVDFQLIEKEPDTAEKIAKENFENLRKLVGASDWSYRSGKKRWRYNETYGTATIIDEPETIERVKEFLDHQPYSIAYEADG